MYVPSRLKLLLIAGLSCAVCLILFYRDRALLRPGDPAKARAVELSFHALQAVSAPQIAFCEGFINQGQGLQLAPGKSGKLIFSFDKEKSQGALLRVWFYGDRGEERPNAIQVSSDAGKTFIALAGNGNFTGSVFDLTPFVAQSDRFQLLFTAHNKSPFTPAVLDRVEVIIGRTGNVRPLLPDVPRILTVFCLVFFLCYTSLPNRAPVRHMAAPVLCCAVVLLAVFLRWEELVRVAGTLLSPYARDYRDYAEKMRFFSACGFYSACSGVREPFFISAVKLFFMLTGPADTHLRMVSFVFSVAVVYLTYRVGRGWFNEAAGLIAACIMAVHPYLAELSCRGLREELFTCLLFLFVCFGHVKTGLSPRSRAVMSGVISGCLLLTRIECLPLIMLTLAGYLIFLRRQWNVWMAVATLAIAAVLVLPHFYSTYTRYGDPFYSVNHHTRFYANIEFAGKPGFPTAEQIAREGWYTGPRITPFEYYFKHHSLQQIAARNAAGLVKTTFAMPGAFAEGKGNARRAVRAAKALRDNFSAGQLLLLLQTVFSIIAEYPVDYLLAAVLALSFLAGIVLCIINRQWLVFVCLIAFQVQTSFIASLGIENRLAVHAYPVIALVCAYALSAGCRYIVRLFSGKEAAAGGVLEKEI